MATRKDKFKVDEVIRALTAKGCTITMDMPITKRVNDVEYLPQEQISEMYDKFMQRQDNVEVMKDVVLMGAPSAHAKWLSIFQQKNSRTLAPRQIKRDVTIQAPYTINVSEGHELGNGSWGKIDFLVNYHDFRVSKASTR